MKKASGTAASRFCRPPLFRYEILSVFFSLFSSLSTLALREVVVVVHLDRLEDALSGSVGVEEVVDLIRLCFLFFKREGEFFLFLLPISLPFPPFPIFPPSLLVLSSVHLHILVLVLLVVLEEPPDLVQAVLRQLRNVLEVAVLGVVRVDGDNLVVALALVDHLHHADRFRAQEGHGNDGLLGRGCLG